MIEPISPKESPTEFPDASVDEDDNTDGDIKQIVETGSVTVSKDGHYIHCLTVIGQIEGHFILPPRTSDTVGFLIPLKSSASASPASMSPPTVFKHCLILIRCRKE